MSDSEEEENFCFFGKPLEPYDEDSFPKKKPVSVEDQIATDAQGRRRFHGAFTGGFSAGFFNTVGSLEGWTPSEFKSTRQDKAKTKSQQPEDFMDDEDMGEFGIAPQTVRATKEYSTSKKRKRQAFDAGPIPGEPVLHSILSSGNETIGYLLLKNIGLKSRKVEDDEGEDEEPEQRVYGCEMPKTYEISRHADIDEYPIHPIYKEYLSQPKNNSFGLGYTGLDKSHINLFQPSKLVIREKNQKKLSIAGQAFGVGAFEDDDDDIYVKDDMSRYDFELTSEKKAKKDTISKNDKIHLEDFIQAKSVLKPAEFFAPPTIPHSFTGKHKTKKSRFEPLPEEKQVERKDMNPAIRAKYLGEESAPVEATKPPTPPPEIKKPTEIKKEEPESPPAEIFSNSGLVFDRFVSASKPEDPSNILEEVARAETEHGTQEMRDAARMKLFGPLTRISSDWQPCSLLCRRFNVPEPHVELTNKNRKRTKNLIFQYEQHKDDLVELKPGLSVQSSSNDLTSEVEPELAVASSTNNVVTEEKEVTVEKSTNKEVESAPPIDITDKIDANKNIDLFKAVFLSSSDESENEEDETEKNTENVDNEMRVNILSNTLLPSIIKPMKEGILSNVNFSGLNQEKEEKPPETETPIIAPKLEPNCYGPSLPNVVINNEVKKPVDLCIVEDSEDEWVEKPKKKKTEHKNKKHKSKKSSHKKKHKHKKR